MNFGLLAYVKLLAQGIWTSGNGDFLHGHACWIGSAGQWAHGASLEAVLLAIRIYEAQNLIERQYFRRIATRRTVLNGLVYWVCEEAPLPWYVHRFEIKTPGAQPAASLAQGVAFEI